MNSNVAIEYRKDITDYPSGKYYYNPSNKYPEYPFGDEIAGEENPVYDMVRNTLYSMGYDRDNFGKKEWNPLGDIIKKNQKILVKPNWVMHINKAIDDEKDLRALVTHPSVVRAIVDYVYIALTNSGEIYVADAPMQECNLEEALKKAGYDELFEFWRKYIPNIKIRDLRHYSTVIENNVILEKKDNDYNESIVVDLKDKSYHKLGTNNNGKYKVSQYMGEDTQNYHNEKEHKYVLNKIVLEADVIINIPKPKCHRLAGMTAALKNMVGVIYDKNSLPHRKIGSVEEGGDAYKKKNIFKHYMEVLDEKKTDSSLNKHYNIAQFYSFFEKVFYVLGSVISRDKVRIGGWYGNDTIWRTILDLNTIINYGDKNGNICDEKQRKMLILGDMIICGQKNGPVKPSPKTLGMVMLSENSYAFDSTMCKIMGFKYDMIKYIAEYAINNEQNIEVIFNGKKNLLSNMQIDNEWKFEPHDMWKEYEN